MACDLKIAIGSIVPHGGTGFGGGSKIILPGVASMDTIVTNHSRSVHVKNRINIMGAEPKDNLLRQDMDEAAQLAGLDIKIDAILNAWGETTHLFVGEPIKEYYEGVKVAKDVYATDLVRNSDIVISNNYAKANEGMIGMMNGAKSLKEEGGDLILIAHAPEGQVVHYAGGAFGSETFGRLYIPKTTNPARINNLIFYTHYIDRASWGLYAPMENIKWVKTWEGVLENLSENGPEPKVAVYPDLTLQYFPEA
jgi:nickel-dependent lactate racemase